MESSQTLNVSVENNNIFPHSLPHTFFFAASIHQTTVYEMAMFEVFEGWGKWGPIYQFEFMKDIVTADTQWVVAAKKLRKFFINIIIKPDPEEVFFFGGWDIFIGHLGCYNLSCEARVHVSRVECERNMVGDHDLPQLKANCSHSIQFCHIVSCIVLSHIKIFLNNRLIAFSASLFLATFAA
jgi:hypothetical protein